LIEGLRRRAARLRKNPAVTTGIGDDCAVLRIPAGHELLVTTDLSVEGTHFRRDWHAPGVVGHRCLTRGLSDIAAMGGEPLAAFLSLALPPKLPQDWVAGFVRGLMKLAAQFRVTLAGGDTSASIEGITADIVVIGSVPQGEALLRSGARPGDRIYVTGDLGGSAAAIARLLKRPRSKLRAAEYPQHFRPQPRLAIGKWLRQRGLASAMIDISDGLSTDLGHLCEESSVGAEVWGEAIPLATVGRPRRQVELPPALHGGDDYELLFTVPDETPVPKQIAGVKITEIGEITGAKQRWIVHHGLRSELREQGWEHFTR
jgi:thiamine-monophosphate kinase